MSEKFHHILATEQNTSMNADKKRMLVKAEIIIHNLIVLMRTKRIEDLTRLVGCRGSRVVKNCGILDALK